MPRIRKKRHYFISDIYGKKYNKKLIGGGQYNFDKRIERFNFITQILQNIPQKVCLENISKELTIRNIIKLGRRFGTKSNNGIIYKTSINDREYPIATKLMKICDGHHEIEFVLGLGISHYIIQRQLSRHFLLCYKAFICKNPSFAMDVIENAPYYMILNELATGDLFNLLDEHLDECKQHILNITLQCILSVATLHKLGYVHQDCHFGNFLYHKTGTLMDISNMQFWKKYIMSRIADMI